MPVKGCGCFSTPPTRKRKADSPGEASAPSPQSPSTAAERSGRLSSLKTAPSRKSFSNELHSSAASQQEQDHAVLLRLGRVWLKRTDDSSVRAETLWQDKAALILIFSRPGNMGDRAEARKLDQYSGTFDRLGVRRVAVFQEWEGSEVDAFVRDVWTGESFLNPGRELARALGAHGAKQSAGVGLLKVKVLKAGSKEATSIPKAAGMGGGVMVVRAGMAGVQEMFQEEVFKNPDKIKLILDACSLAATGKRFSGSYMAGEGGKEASGSRARLDQGAKRPPSIDWSNPTFRRGAGGDSSDEGPTNKRRSIDRARASFSLEDGRKSLDIRQTRASLSIEREKLLAGSPPPVRPWEKGDTQSPPRAAPAMPHPGTSSGRNPERETRKQPPSAARLQELQMAMQGVLGTGTLSPITEADSARNSISTPGQSMEIARVQRPTGRGTEGGARGTKSPKQSLERLRKRTGTSSPKSSIEVNLEAARVALAGSMSPKSSLEVEGRRVMVGTDGGQGGVERGNNGGTVETGNGKWRPAAPPANVEAVRAILAKSSLFK